MGMVRVRCQPMARSLHEDPYRPKTQSLGWGDDVGDTQSGRRPQEYEPGTGLGCQRWFLWLTNLKLLEEVGEVEDELVLSTPQS